MTESTGSIVSPTTGLEYDTKLTVVEDACRDCGGEGAIWFSTFSDYRRFIVDERARQEENDPDDDYYYTPDKSGSRSCERCGSTGVFKGDGGLYRMTMTYSGSIGVLPEEMFST